MAKNIIEYELKLKVDQFKSELRKSKGEYAAMISAISELIKRLPKRGILADGFKDAKKDAKDLREELRKLQKVANPTVAQKTKVIARTNFVADKMTGAAQEAYYNRQYEALKKLTYAQRYAIIESAKFDKTQRLNAKAARDLNQALEKSASVMMNHFVQQRYALYDLSSSLNQVSKIMLNFANTAMQAGIAQQEAFAGFRKTQIDISLDPAGQKKLEVQIGKVKDDLIDLSTEIPKSFSELSVIATLGAQLGISSDNIKGFTETVAKFSAVTGVSVEETALAFGKLANILGVSSADYDKLASSIAYVGVKAAATEAQILSTAKQIGAIGHSAGMTATEVIGLSSAFASLAVAPEEARGIVQNTFHTISMATASYSDVLKKGNSDLQVFSKTAGMTAKEFANAWKKAPTETFLKFEEGLAKTNIDKTLESIGLAGVRTSKGLTALAQNIGDVRKQMEQAAAGANNMFLDKSFAEIVDTVASKLLMAKNAVDALFSSVTGSPEILTAFMGILDSVISVTNGLRELNKIPIVQFFSTAGFALTVLIGGLTALAASVGIGVATMLALRTAILNVVTVAGEGSLPLLIFALRLTGLKAEAIEAMLATKGLSGALGGLSVAETVATGGATALKIALRTLAASTVIGLVVVALGFLAEWLITLGEQAPKTGEGLDEAGKVILSTGDSAISSAEDMKTFVDALLAAEDAAIAAGDAVYGLGSAIKENGKAWGITTKAGRDNMKAVDSVIKSYTDKFGESNKETIAQLFIFWQTLKASGEASGAMLDYIRLKIVAIANQANEIPPNFNLFGGAPVADPDIMKTFLEGMKNIGSGAGAAQTALEKLQSRIEKLFKSMNQKMTLIDSLASLGEAFANNNTFSQFSKDGRDNIKSLEDVINNLAESSNGNLQKMANSLAALKRALKETGASASAIKLVDKALKDTGKSGKASASDIKLFKNALLEAAKAKSGIVALEEAIRGISSAVTESLSATFAYGNAIDDITLGWLDMADAAASAQDRINGLNDNIRSARNSITDAKNAILQANAAIAELTAQKGTLEYQLSIAIKYGDTLRAAELQAQISGINADIASQQNNIADANQQIADSNQAIADAQNQIANANDARAIIEKARALQDMANKYAIATSYMLVNAAKGTDLNKVIDDQVQAFYDNAIQMGYTKEEAGKMADTLKTSLLAQMDKVNKTKVKVKVSAETKAALDAISSFVTKANARLANLKKSITITVTTAGVGVPAATGGLITGPGSATSDSIPANLSNGEYVVKASAVKYYGLEFMNSLNNNSLRSSDVSATRIQSSQSGGGSNTVYLSPEDRALLRAAIDRPINLYTDNATIAKSANDGNQILARRGVR